jgi:hypothetical protein
MKRSLGGGALALALALGAAALGLGCGSSSAAGSSPDTAPTFTDVYNDIISPICSTCHTPKGIAPFLDMSSQASAYSNLVGVKADGPACGKSGATRVVASNAKESLMFEKVSEDPPPCGKQMPLGCSGADCLSASLQQEIENWINAGALNN